MPIYLTNMNLSGNELQNAVIQPLAVAPSNPTLYQIYTDSISGKIRQWNGISWKTIGVIVESSANNGHITIDGIDMTVYAHPTRSATTASFKKVGNDSEGHVVLGDDVSLSDITQLGAAPIVSPIFTGTPKSTTPSSSDNSTNIATTAYVQSVISGLLGATVFKGTINANITLEESSYKSGWNWIVGASGTYAGIVCEVGDWIYAVADKEDNYSTSDFSVIQGNLINAVTSDDPLPSDELLLGNGNRGIKTSTKTIVTSITDADSKIPTAGAVVDYAQPNNSFLTSLSNVLGTGIVRRTNPAGVTVGSAVENSELYYMPALTIKGNNTNELTSPKDISISELKTMLGFPQKVSISNPAITSSGGTAIWTVTHNLGTSDIIVSVYEISTGESVIMDVTLTSNNVVTLSWVSSSNVASDTYRAVIIG